MTYFEIPAPAITDRHRSATKDRLGGTAIAAIVRAFHASDERCVTCGLVTWIDVMPADMTAGDRATFGHIIPASEITPGFAHGDRSGYTTDNGVLQCADCNNGIGATRITLVHYIPAYLGAARFAKIAKPATASRADVKRQTRANLGYAA